MNSKTFYFLFFLVPNVVFSQATRWEDHFNYALVQEINQVGNKLYCTSSNALFSYDLEFNEVQKISKANRLNAVKPTSVTYNPDFDYLIVGYQSGELDILGEESFNFIEIPLDEYAGSKSINHLSTQGNLMLISAAYGVSIFDLERREFSETAFFRQNGEFFTANESDFYDGQVFTASERGIFSHPINDLIPNFNNWTRAEGIPVQSYQHIQTFGNRLLAAAGGNLYAFQDGNWFFVQNFGNIVDLNVNGGFLTVSTSNRVVVFDENMNQIAQQNFSNNLQCGIIANNQVYGGTLKNGLMTAGSTEGVFPDGPFTNNSFGVTAVQGNIYSAPGGMNDFNIPTYNRDGYSHFTGTEWVHITFNMLDGAFDIVQIAVNPNDVNQAYASSWQENKGVFEVENDEVENHYTFNEMGVSEDYSVMRFGGSNFDEQGNLYVTQTFVGSDARNTLFKKTPDGVWSSIDLINYLTNSAGIRPPTIGRDGWVWVAGTRGDGLMISNMDENYLLLTGEGTGDLPSNNVYAACIDDNGTAWIGTQRGLHVKSNPIREIQSGNLDTEPIVIVQNGIPEALLTDTSVLDIENDSSNRKWIATQGAGVFYVTEYGRETIFNFKEENSPLPSDIVYDISVDESTGIIYFATEDGLVSYRGDAVNSGDSFGEVVAYPNPVRPGYEGVITIKGIAENADVRITDVVGNLIYKGRSSGGIVQWNQNNLQGKRVASGVYLVLMINSEGMETAHTKIAIVR